MGGREVRPTERLGALQVGVCGEEGVVLLVGSRDDAVEEVLQVADEDVGLVQEPQSKVGRDLVVSGSTGVQLASNVLADELGKSSLVGGVDVLVIGSGDKLSPETRQSGREHCFDKVDSGRTLTRFSSHSFATSPRPRSISLCSCSDRMPTLGSAFE